MEVCNKCGLPFATQQELATHAQIKHAESPYSFLDGECPVKTPILLSAKSTVETCASCGKWVQRYPSFMGDDDGYWQCEKCGCTSIRSRTGRPYGPKSKRWEWVVEQFNDLFLDIAPWDRDTVQSTPLLKELDWEAVENWFNANNIYRGFINIEIVELTES